MGKTNKCCPECMSENISWEKNEALSTAATFGIKFAKGVLCKKMGIHNHTKIPDQPVRYYKCHDCGAIFFTPLELD